MPRLNRRGDVLGGIAGIPASVNGVEFAPGIPSGGGEWLTDNLVVLQADLTRADNFKLYTVRPSDPQFVRMGEYGCDALAAGAGVYIAAFRQIGTTASSGLRLPGAWPLKGSFEGELAVCDDYQAGHGLTLFNRDFEVIDRLPVFLAMNDVFVRDGVLSFWEIGRGFRLRDYRRNADVQLLHREGVNWLVPVVAPSGELLVLERHDLIGLTLRRPYSFDARVLVPGPSEQLFNPDAVFLSAGAFRVAWSLTQGEEAHNVRYLDFADLTALPVIDTSRPPATTPPAPPPVVTLPPAEPPVQPTFPPPVEVPRATPPPTEAPAPAAKPLPAWLRRLKPPAWLRRWLKDVLSAALEGRTK